jgi:tRNA-2-methylthio-N6-dimethylallyladenosine synthase
MQNKLSLQSNQKDIGKTFKVLIEGNSRRSSEAWMGRNSQNKVVIFKKEGHDLKAGDYVNVKVHDCSQATLLGEIVQLHG